MKNAPNHHDQHRRDLVERLSVRAQRGPERCRTEAERDEDRREARDKQEARDQHAPGARVLELARVDPDHRRQVAGHERQHARGKERDRSRRERRENTDSAGWIHQLPSA
jgi:hypothetical protein